MVETIGDRAVRHRMSTTGPHTQQWSDLVRNPNLRVVVGAMDTFHGLLKLPPDFSEYLLVGGKAPDEEQMLTTVNSLEQTNNDLCTYRFLPLRNTITNSGDDILARSFEDPNHGCAFKYTDEIDQYR